MPRFLTVTNVNKTFFTDEKLFKLNQPRNTQNGSVCCKERGISTEWMVVKRKTFPKNLMISVGFSELGKTLVFFSEPGVKINAQYYRYELLAGMHPEMNNLSRCD